MRQLLVNFAKATGVITLTILVIMLLLAPPRLLSISVTNTAGTSVGAASLRFNTSSLAVPLFRTDHYFLYLYADDVQVTVRAAGYESAEFEADQVVSPFSGSVEHSSVSSFFHHLEVTLEREDPNLLMTSYRGVLTTGGAGALQVVAIHPDFRGTHQPLNWLLRQFSEKTGKPKESLKYLRLIVERDAGRAVQGVFLDFSHADGGALEYEPPDGWPAGNLIRRIEASMTMAPDIGYRSRFPIAQHQADTAYENGATFFYCMIDGHYCAGQVTTYSRRAGEVQEAHVQVTINRTRGDKRIRR